MRCMVQRYELRPHAVGSFQGRPTTIGTGNFSPLNDLTPGEAEFLHNLRWTDNEITSGERAFLRDNRLGGPTFIVDETLFSETASTPSRPFPWAHERGCRCWFPRSCTLKTEPPPIENNRGAFGTIGYPRPISASASVSSSPSGPIASSPPTSISTIGPRLPPGLPFFSDEHNGNALFGVMPSEWSTLASPSVVSGRLYPQSPILAGQGRGDAFSIVGDGQSTFISAPIKVYEIPSQYLNFLDLDEEDENLEPENGNRRVFPSTFTHQDHENNNAAIDSRMRHASTNWFGYFQGSSTESRECRCQSTDFVT